MQVEIGARLKQGEKTWLVTQLEWERTISFSERDSDEERLHLRARGFLRIDVDDFEEGEQIETTSEAFRQWANGVTLHVPVSVVVRRLGDGSRRPEDYRREADAVPEHPEGNNGGDGPDSRNDGKEGVPDNLHEPGGASLQEV